jgi:hypothetical protein
LVTASLGADTRASLVQFGVFGVLMKAHLKVPRFEIERPNDLEDTSGHSQVGTG